MFKKGFKVKLNKKMNDTDMNVPHSERMDDANNEIQVIRTPKKQKNDDKE